jgi:hypothetical protein
VAPEGGGLSLDAGNAAGEAFRRRNAESALQGCLEAAMACPFPGPAPPAAALLRCALRPLTDQLSPRLQASAFRRERSKADRPDPARTRHQSAAHLATEGSESSRQYVGMGQHLKFRLFLHAYTGEPSESRLPIGVIRRSGSRAAFTLFGRAQFVSCYGFLTSSSSCTRSLCG